MTDLNLEWKFRFALWAMQRTGYKRFHEISVEEARALDLEPRSFAKDLFLGALIPLPHVEDIEIDVRHGKIRGRVYKPTANGVHPLLVYFHGGGFAVGSIEGHDNVCRQLARDGERIVVSVDYRLAPEHKFPAGVEDAFDSVVWVAENAEKLGGTDDDLAVAGDSAGANLSAVVCQMLRDAGAPVVSKQILIYPAVNSSVIYPSEETYRDAPILGQKDIQRFTDLYVNDRSETLDPRCSPILGRLEDLPPAFVFTAEYDPLIDDGRLYAEGLEAAGNDVQYKMYPRMVHGFINFPPVASQAKHAYADMSAFLKDKTLGKRATMADKLEDAAAAD